MPCQFFVDVLSSVPFFRDPPGIGDHLFPLFVADSEAFPLDGLAIPSVAQLSF